MTETPTHSPGQRVRHPEHGEGIVLDADRDGYIRAFFAGGVRLVAAASLRLLVGVPASSAEARSAHGGANGRAASRLDARAHSVVLKLAGSPRDIVAGAEESRALIATKDAVRARWLDFEVGGYLKLAGARPLHDVLGVDAGDELALNVAAYRAQVGRSWSASSAGDPVVHFFAESLTQILDAHDKVSESGQTGALRLCFGAYEGAPDHPNSIDFPIDVFERILRGFAITLGRELAGLRR